MRRKVQLFIHRYYENIKLVLLVIILGLSSYAILAILANNAESSKDRGEAVIRIVKSIERETDEQTKVINRQFQALCFLLVETSGAEALKKLDPPLEDQCRNLARELREEERREQSQPLRVTPQPVSNPRQQATPQTPAQRLQPTVNQQPTIDPQPQAPTAPQLPEQPQGVLDRVLEPVDYLMERIRGIL